MHAQPPLPLLVPSPRRLGRVEYLGFQDVAEHREFRFRLHGPEGWSTCRLRIALAAFGAGTVRRQDGPDVCYRKLLGAVADDEAASPDVITIDDADLASYREATTPVPKHRSWTRPSPPTPAAVPRRPPRAPSRPLPVAPLLTKDTGPAFEEGQRVSHAVFGVGVTSSSSSGHTVVCFDEAGPKTFVTSMLEVDVLSPPHTWETGPRGRNRPCPTPAPEP